MNFFCHLNICFKYLIQTLVLISTTQRISLFQFCESNWSNSRIYRPHLLHLSSLPFSSLLSLFDIFPLLHSLPLFSSSQIQKVKMEPPKYEDGESENGGGFGIVDEEAKFWSGILYLWLPGEYNARLD